MFGFLLYAVALIQPEPDLIAKSKVLFKPGAWTEYSSSVPNYCWINSQEVLYSVGQGISIPYSEPPWYRLNIRNLDSHELTGLKMNTPNLEMYSSPLPNPQGTKVLWSAYRKGSGTKWVVTKLDGSLIDFWSRKAVAMIASAAGQDQSWDEWSLDGNSIFESESKFENGKLGLHVWRRALSGPSNENAYRILEVQSKPDRRATVFDLGNGNAAWIEQQYADRLTQEVIVHWPLRTPAAARKFSFPVTNNWGFSSPVVSPDRKRVLWEEWNRSVPSVSLWVSHMDFSDFHEIGVVKLDQERAAHGEPGFGEVHWIPGQLAASYYFNGNVREVEID